MRKSLSKYGKLTVSRVRAADRTLSIFEAFEATGRPLALSEIARAVGVPVSSCHALVGTLLERGYLYSTPRRRELYPTKRLFELARSIIARDPLLGRVAATMAELRKRTGETLIFGKRQGDTVLYLEVLEGPHTIRYTAHPGEHKPLHSSSIGKALLATLGENELAAWLKGRRLPALTPNTITDAKRLEAELRRTRERGWAMTRGENVVDVLAVAVPVRLAGETYGLAVAGPMHRMMPAHEKHAALLVQTGRRLEDEAP